MQSKRSFFIFLTAALLFFAGSCIFSLSGLPDTLQTHLVRETAAEPDSAVNSYYAEGTAAGIPVLSTAPEPPEDSLAVPILMYHGLLKSETRQNRFVISPAVFEQDLAYLQKNGYETITMSQLIAYVKDGAPLPEKPIVLTFDDGYYNNYLYAFPLLAQYDAKAVLAIIGRYTDEYSQSDADHPEYSHVTWDEINEMVASGRVEIQNHTYDMHTYDKGRKGSSQKEGESTEVYRAELENDVVRLQQEIFEKTGTLPNTFVYPFGYASNGSGILLREMGFEASLSCTEGINYFPLDETKRTEDSLFMLKRILRPPNLSSADFFARNKIK